MKCTQRKNVKFRLRDLLLVVLFILIGCEDHSENKNNEYVKFEKTNVIQIKFIGHWLNEGSREKLVRDFVRKYEFENQHLEIVLKFPEEIYFNRSEKNSNQKFIANIINQDKPEWDIVRINNEFAEIADLCKDSLWAKNNLVDFSQFPDFIRGTKSELLTDELKQQWGGIIPGPLLEGQYRVLWSNKEVAQKLGVQIKQYGMTFDDFKGYIKVVSKYNKNNPNDYITPIHDSYDWRTGFNIAFELYISALNDNKILFDLNYSEKKIKAWYKTLQALEELSYFYPYDPNWENDSWEETKLDLVNGNCLFYSNGSWMYNIWNSKNSDKINNCIPNEFPTFSNRTIYPSSYAITWGVLKKSPNKEEAIKLLLAMNTPEMAEMWVQFTKCPTGINGRFTDVSFGSDLFEDFSNHIQITYQNKTYQYNEDASKFINGNPDCTKTYYSEVLTGKMTADEAIERMKKDL